jgi:hypothetical protein
VRQHTWCLRSQLPMSPLISSARCPAHCFWLAPCRPKYMLRPDRCALGQWCKQASQLLPLLVPCVSHAVDMVYAD